MVEHADILAGLRHDDVSVIRVDVLGGPVAAGDLDDARQEGTIHVTVRGQGAYA